MVWVTYERLHQGVEGTKRTLQIMAQAVRGELPPDYSGFQDEFIRQTAINVCVSVQGHDSVGEIMALFFYTRDQVAYRRDPVDTERVQDARRTIELRSGDCDDKCVLLASLLASMGYLPRFVVQTQDGNNFDHVYIEVENEGRWIALDPTADGSKGIALATLNWRNPAASEWIYKIFGD